MRFLLALLGLLMASVGAHPPVSNPDYAAYWAGRGGIEGEYDDGRVMEGERPLHTTVLMAMAKASHVAEAERETELR